jgi:hypothetical protein
MHFNPGRSRYVRNFKVRLQRALRNAIGRAYSPLVNGARIGVRKERLAVLSGRYRVAAIDRAPGRPPKSLQVNH